MIECSSGKSSPGSKYRRKAFLSRYGNHRPRGLGLHRLPDLGIGRGHHHADGEESPQPHPSAQVIIWLFLSVMIFICMLPFLWLGWWLFFS